MTAGGVICARDVTGDALLIWRYVTCAKLLAPLTVKCPSCGRFDLEGVIWCGSCHGGVSSGRRSGHAGDRCLSVW